MCLNLRICASLFKSQQCILKKQKESFVCPHGLDFGAFKIYHNNNVAAGKKVSNFELNEVIFYSFIKYMFCH